MINMNYKPFFLPQINISYNVIIEELEKEGIGCSLIEVDPNELEPLQGIVFSDDVGNVDLSDVKPIYIANQMKVVDGHHRVVRALLDGVKIKAVKINLDYKDACRILNKIQDIFEYENSRSLEEVEVQDAINYYGDDDNQFLRSLEETNDEIRKEKPSLNQQTLIAYRKEPIKENSIVGNFFTLAPLEGYNEYEIEFDNLLDTNVLGITYKEGQQPVDILAKIWFPNINFEELSKINKTSSNNIKNKAVAEKAIKLGFDGIKYGDKLIQGLK